MFCKILTALWNTLYKVDIISRKIRMLLLFWNVVIGGFVYIFYKKNKNKQNMYVILTNRYVLSSKNMEIWTS